MQGWQEPKTDNPPKKHEITDRGQPILSAGFLKKKKRLTSMGCEMINAQIEATAKRGSLKKSDGINAKNMPKRKAFKTSRFGFFSLKISNIRNENG